MIFSKKLLPTLHPIATFLHKHPSDFTKSDLVLYMEKHDIHHLNFLYVAGDGRLKTLNFVVLDKDYLDEVLTCGERVDGSSLFSFAEASSSDLYVIPRYSTAFVDPFSAFPTLALLCSFFDKDGNRLESSSEYILEKACQTLQETTGLEFQAMGELEYYVIGPEKKHFPANDQRGYHESAPFASYSNFRQLCMKTIAEVGGRLKYGHCEVGNFHMDGKTYEQHEIEFLPVPAMLAADQLVLAKWIIRNLAHRKNLEVTFAPKITTGRAGSGLHIHMRLMKNGVNQMLHEGAISDTAKQAIAGMMTLAPSLTAFGNTIPTSYLRLVPEQEAPTNVCWGDRNRSALVRVPLGWTASNLLEKVANTNPQEHKHTHYNVSQKQTVEMRSADGSANLYLLLAGLAVACRTGLEMKNALEVANKTYIQVNIHKPENRPLLEHLDSLPRSCVASAETLEKDREYYESLGVFSKSTIDSIVAKLRSFSDDNLREEIENDPEKTQALVSTYFHCG